MPSVNLTYITLPIFLPTDFFMPLYKQNKSQNKVFMTKCFFLFIVGRKQKVFLAFVIISCLFLSFLYLRLLGRGKILDFYLVLFGSADKDCKFSSKISWFWYSPRMVTILNVYIAKSVHCYLQGYEDPEKLGLHYQFFSEN